MVIQKDIWVCQVQLWNRQVVRYSFLLIAFLDVTAAGRKKSSINVAILSRNYYNSVICVYRYGLIPGNYFVVYFIYFYMSHAEAKAPITLLFEVCLILSLKHFDRYVDFSYFFFFIFHLLADSNKFLVSNMLLHRKYAIFPR